MSTNNESDCGLINSIDSYRSSIKAYFMRRGLGIDLAEEFTQETIYRAVNSINKLKNKDLLRSWIFGIAKHVLLESYREDNKLSQSAIDNTASDINCRLEIKDRQATIESALRELSAPARTAVIMRFVEGKSCKEIAETLSSSPEAVSALLYRSKKLLKPRLERLLA